MCADVCPPPDGPQPWGQQMVGKLLRIVPEAKLEVIVTVCTPGERRSPAGLPCCLLSNITLGAVSKWKLSATADRHSREVPFQNCSV